MHNLNNKWTLWLHLPYDTDWSINSYKKVTTFETLEDCIILIENINKEIVEKCMLFIMKNNIKPIWEDVENSKGGCLSYKITTDNVYEVWKKLNYYLIGETLMDDKDIMDNINGISISPKKNFCIIKFWIKNTENLKNNSIYNELNIETQSVDNEKRDPFKIDMLCDIEKQHCLFKEHEILY
tara:strand:+ start:3062 stop:3607 length:546 start_codon:yes stop_codon:yes gene_type:complete